jgi:hypothetical protein
MMATRFCAQALVTAGVAFGARRVGYPFLVMHMDVRMPRAQDAQERRMHMDAPV